MESPVRPVKLAIASAAAALLMAPAAGRCEDKYFRLAPATAPPPAARPAVQYELKLFVSAGGDFAVALRDAGINDADSVAAEKLAIGDLADRSGGCNAKLSITRTVDGGEFRLARALLIMADGRQTVIERRGADLAIVSRTPPRKSLRLV